MLGAYTFYGMFGVKQNSQEAIHWLTLAAEQRNVGAQSLLSLIYRSGVGTPKNNVEAAKWIILAAAGGCHEAMRQSAFLGLLTSPSDLKTATHLAAVWDAGHARHDPHDHRDYRLGICDVGHADPAI